MEIGKEVANYQGLSCGHEARRNHTFSSVRHQQGPQKSKLDENATVCTPGTLRASDGGFPAFSKAESARHLADWGVSGILEELRKLFV